MYHIHQISLSLFLSLSFSLSFSLYLSPLMYFIYLIHDVSHTSVLIYRIHLASFDVTHDAYLRLVTACPGDGGGSL